MCRELVDVDQGNMDKLAISIPRVVARVKDRCSDCYSCLVNTQLYIKKDKCKMEKCYLMLVNVKMLPYACKCKMYKSSTDYTPIAFFACGTAELYREKH